MKIYDITQEVFSSMVYPGDPSPARHILSAVSKGDKYNLTAFSMCAHNGTHIDAPSHFIDGAGGIDRVAPERFVGAAAVVTHSGDLNASDAERLLDMCEKLDTGAAKRILFRKNTVITAEAARVLAERGVYLVGVESQSVGPVDSPMEVHVILLSRGIVLLEGIRLSDVPDGIYFLSAAPILLADSDGAPCRALLIERDGFWK